LVTTLLTDNARRPHALPDVLLTHFCQTNRDPESVAVVIDVALPGWCTYLTKNAGSSIDTIA